MADREYQLDAEMYINEPAVDAGREYQASAETYINEPAGGGGGGLAIPVAMAQYRQRWN